MKQQAEAYTVCMRRARLRTKERRVLQVKPASWNKLPREQPRSQPPVWMRQLEQCELTQLVGIHSFLGKYYRRNSWDEFRINLVPSPRYYGLNVSSSSIYTNTTTNSPKYHGVRVQGERNRLSSATADTASPTQAAFRV